MNVNLRKTEVNLSTVGTGVILFGVWMLIKFALTFFFIGTQTDGDVSGFTLVIANIIMWSFCALYCLACCYIGFSARAEGSGKRKGVLYLIVTGVLTLLQLACIAFEVYSLVKTPDTMLTMFITIIIDATFFAILLEVTVNSIRLRRYRKQWKGEQG